jgi:xylulokinase
MALYLGLDSSTQSLTAVVIDTVSGGVSQPWSVNFGADLPQYGCPQGFLPDPDPLVRHADPRLWAAALERVLATLRREGVDLGAIAGISGSGQQHGTVYLRRPFPGTLARGETLADLVGRSLTRPTAPIWMDSSTGSECREIDAALGGAAEVRRRSGSSAVERFAGPQIRRFAKTEAERYTRTELIHLVSSFMCSLLLGKSAPIDLGDGAGMNLLNLAAATWDPDLLQATARGLAARLPATVPSTACCGTVAPYLVERYGFQPGTQVVAWSGDNPNSLIGVGGWRPGTAVISLGTSDTYFAAMSTPAVDPQGCGHVFGNPAGGFMCLICFKNGSLAREHVKDEHGLSWSQFDVESFAATPPGNGGRLLLPYFVPEITPVVLRPGVVRRGDADFVAGRDAAASVRAIVEAQALSMKLHSGWIGETPAAIRVTGGASRSDGICQVLADVFDASVERLEVGNSAALGAALRAAQALEKLPWDEVSARFCRCDVARTLTPNRRNVAVYQALLPAFAAFEAEHREACRREVSP